MDLIVIPCTLQKRTPNRLNTKIQDSLHFAKTNPSKFRNPKFSTNSPKLRIHSQIDRKSEDNCVRGYNLFENIYITNTIQFNESQISNSKQPQSLSQPKSQLNPNTKILKKENRLIIFKPIPKDRQLKSSYQSPEKQNTIIYNQRRRESKLKKIMENEFMKSSQDKEKLFSDKNCRIILNDVSFDSYFQ